VEKKNQKNKEEGTLLYGVKGASELQQKRRHWREERGGGEGCRRLSERSLVKDLASPPPSGAGEQLYSKKNLVKGKNGKCEEAP